ncbi:hypothetical protein [Streptomyces sp. NBC_00996]|uniref:hypothetical protein n=1 Tax=Streptomyces sp. NBC_00996 TaxID=2903710 RepID=UPI00386E9CFD|nr:hypothetical protein OG390_15715 [Streptomyces sp. NBC_00996]
MEGTESTEGTERTPRREAMKGRVGGPEASGAVPPSAKAMKGEGAAGEGAAAGGREPGGTGIPPEEGVDTPARRTPTRETPVRETPAREPLSGERGPDRPGAVAAARAGESADTPRRGGDAKAAERAGAPGRPAAHGSGLLPQDECDKFSLRLRHAVGGFVDGPRDAVEEADHLLEELAARFTEAVTRRRRTLRTSWQPGDRATATTEDLRLALRDYREMTERLLRL